MQTDSWGEMRPPPAPTQMSLTDSLSPVPWARDASPPPAHTREVEAAQSMVVAESTVARREMEAAKEHCQSYDTNTQVRHTTAAWEIAEATTTRKGESELFSPVYNGLMGSEKAND